MEHRPSDADHEDLMAKVLEALADGPRDEDQLVTALGLDPDEDATWHAFDEIEDDRRIVPLADERLARGDLLLDGLVSWHRLGPWEAEHRRVRIGADAAAQVSCAATPYVVVVGGRAVDITVGVDDDAGALHPDVVLPDDWEPDLAEGDLVALTADGGEVRLLRPPAPEPSSPAANGALGRAVGEIGREQGVGLVILDRSGSADAWVIDLGTAIPLVLADRPSVLRDLTVPLTEALGDAGLPMVEGLVGGPAVTPPALEALHVGRMIAGDREDDDPGLAEVVGTAWCAVARDTNLSNLSVDALLDDPDLIEALVGHLRDASPHEVSTAATTLAPIIEDDVGQGCVWLLAELMVVRGRASLGLEILIAAFGDADPDEDETWIAAIESLARLHAVAGDIDSARRAFARTGNHHLAGQLERWRPSPPSGVGRNEPCPCGSGRKFKQCCLRHPPARDLGERVSFVWWKATSWCFNYRALDLPGLGAIDLEGGDIPPFGVMVGAYLCEDGFLPAVIAEIGDLMPADELTMVEAWTDLRHRLWEVEGSTSTTVRLRDLVTGGGATVPADDLPGARRSELALAVVAPVGDGERILGNPTPVSFTARDRVIEALAQDPDGDDVVALVVGLRRTPTITAADGDPLVWHEVRWEVPDGGVAIAALDAAHPRNADEPNWVDVTEGGSVRWSLELDGTTLTGSALSDRRGAALMAAVEAAVPDAVLVDHTESPADDMLAAARRRGPGFGAPSALGSPPDDPETAALLDSFIRAKEVEWCDESIPALGGLTPREALDDPTRREDLLRVLRSFPAPARSGGFDADRIAGLLGVAGEL